MKSGSMPIYIYTHMYAYTHMYVHTHIICMYTHVCMHTHTCMHTHKLTSIGTKIGLGRFCFSAAAVGVDAVETDMGTGSYVDESERCIEGVLLLRVYSG
jgi:hypothetical protein